MKRTLCILLVIIMSLSLFSCSKSEVSKSSGIVYIDGGELKYRDNKTTVSLSKLSDMPTDTTLYSYFNSPLEFCNYNEKTERLFHPAAVTVLRPRDMMSPISVDLCYKDMKTGTNTEVATDVHSYQVSTDGNIITYQDARALYSVNLKTGEKIEVTSGLCDGYAASANGEDVYYIINGTLTKYNYFKTEVITEKGAKDIVLYDGKVIFYTKANGDYDKLCAYTENGIFDIAENPFAVKAGKNGEYFVFINSTDKRSNSGTIYKIKTTKSGFSEMTVVAEKANRKFFEVDNDGNLYHVYLEDLFSESPVFYCNETVISDDQPLYQLLYASGADKMYVAVNDTLMVVKNEKLETVYEYKSEIKNEDDLVYEFEQIDYIVTPDGTVYIESETNVGLSYYVLTDNGPEKICENSPAYADLPKYLGIQKAPLNPAK